MYGYGAMMFSISTDAADYYLRLSPFFLPKHYDVELIPDLESEGSRHAWNGSVSMLLETPEDIDFNPRYLTFHSDQLSIDSISLYEVDATGEKHKLKPGTIAYDFQRTFVHVSQRNESQSYPEFSKGTTYELQLSFKADQQRGPYYSYGFYHRPCDEDSTNEKQCWFTQFEATLARNAFPCLDEPGFKATFSMKVSRSEEYHTISNMPLSETVPMDGKSEWFTDVFETSVEMSPYLVAVGLTNYKPLRSDTSNTTVWGPEADIEGGRGDYAIDIGPKIISFYEEYFQVKYPLPKMDLMYEVKKGGAMENWGLILFDPRALMLDADANDDTRWTVLSVVAHELAHQWFGNLVTCNWWSETWLNEGFATFVSYLATDHLDPNINSWGRMLVKETQRVMLADEDTSKHSPITEYIESRDDIDRMFGMWSYQKGGSILRMTEEILSKETFTKGLTSYLTSFSYGSTTEDDLFLHLEEAAIVDGKWPMENCPTDSFAEIMKSWTNQAGLPVIHASKVEADPTRLVFNQKWLVSNEATSEERRWAVPLTFTTVSKDNPQPGWEIQQPQAWISFTSESFSEPLESLRHSAFVVNIQGTGYYRVNYDESNWVALAYILSTDRELIHPLNRAQIICDIVALTQTGHVSEAIRDLVLSYESMETDYAPKLAFERCTSGFKENDDHFDRI